jgi:transcriptional regulator with XRE-family HTH domain/quercetin dioxygenase-like cupin family protein
VSPPDFPPIGARIRAERVRRNWTLRGLAREIGVSASLISQIETGKSQPSVSTLYAITTALELPIEELFAAREESEVTPSSEVAVATVEEHRDLVADGAAELGSTADAVAPLAPVPVPGGTLAMLAGTQPDRARCVGPVVHPDGRETIQLESGVTWELLGQVPGVHVEFLRVTYPPGSASAASGQLMRHPGTEYGYVVAGELTLSLAFEEHHLTPGVSFSFASSTPHRYRNDGTEPAVGIWFVLGDT